MGTLRAGLSRLFLEPAASVAVAPAEAAWLPLAPSVATPAWHAPSVAVVCTARDAAVAAGAAGLAAATLARARWALLAEWGTDDMVQAPDRAPGRAARRAAEALRMHGHAVRATGRLVHVALGRDGTDVAAGVERLAAAPGPAITVVAGPRDETLDGILAACDRLLLVVRGTADEDIVALAEAELAALGPAVQTIRLAGAPAAAALARSGTALVAPLRGPFLAALREAGALQTTT